MRKGEEGRKSGKGRGRKRRAREGTYGGRQRMTWDCNVENPDCKSGPEHTMWTHQVMTKENTQTVGTETTRKSRTVG